MNQQFILSVSQYEKIALLVTGVLFFLFFIMMIIYAVSKLIPSNYDKKIKNQTNSVRIIAIDLLKKEVIFFNRSNLRKHRISDLDGFYNQFPEYERQKIKDWLYSLLRHEEEKIANFLEVDVNVTRERKKFFSILHVQNINIERQRIHLESYLLKYVSPVSPDAKSKYILGSQEELENLLLKQKNQRRGATFIVRFYSTKAPINNTSAEVEAIILAQLKNKVFPYANASRLLIQHSNYDIILYDTKIATRGNCLQLAASLNKELEKYLQINGLESNYDFIIGVVENKYFETVDDLIKQARNLAIAGETRKEHITIYNRDTQFADKEKNLFSDELKKLIAEKSLIPTFQPLFNMETGRIFGFTQISQPKLSLFNTLDEIEEYAIRVGQQAEICELIVQQAINNFVEERDNKNQLLLLDVLDFNRQLFIEIVERNIANLELEIAYVFDESTIISSPISEQEELLLQLANNKSKERINILRLKDKNIMINKKIIHEFDYLLIDEKITKNIGKAAKTRLHIHALLEKAHSYHKPFIAINLDSWSSIEIVVKSGIDIISSDIIAPYNNKIKPINKKLLSKLKSFKGETDNN